MTAVSPSCNAVTRAACARRALCGLLAITVAWTPWALVWGDDLFGSSATDGQSLGVALGSDPTRLAPFDHPEDYRTLFPGADAGDLADWTALSDDPAALPAAGVEAQQALVNTPFEAASKTEQAYQTLVAPVDRARPDLASDPLWGTTDATLLSLDTFASTYGDCTWEVSFLNQPRTVHVPVYEACLIADKAQPKLSCAASRTLVAQVFWDPVWGTDPETGEAIIVGHTRRVVKTQDDWTWSPVCPSGLERVKDGFCRSTITCTSHAGADCVAVPGGELCGGELVAPPYHGVTGDEPWEVFSGIGAACLAVHVALDCTSFNEGPMDGWTAPDGVTHAPDNPGDQDNCATLDANPQCRRVSRQCAEAATGATGVCYVDQLVYDCGRDETIAHTTRVSDLNCGGEIRCLGDDCVTFAPEQSDDFGTAVAALHAAEILALDGDCSTGTCEVFKGTDLECKRAVGGIVNCCERPEGISLGHYLRLMFAIAKLDSVILSLHSAGAVTPGFGAWETLRSPLVDTWAAVKDGFTSAVNNLTGHTAAATTEAAKEGVISAFKQQLMRQTAQWTAQVFGPQAANALFVNAAGGGAAVGADGTLIAANIQLGGMIGTVMLSVMWAYLIYTIVMILIQLIWECTEDEFTLGVQRELKACHRVGSYCKKNLFGACIESRDSYCCFNTPLSRLLNEQIRGQIGPGYGRAQAPNCAGLGITALARVNWSAIDLGEWLQMLTAADIILTPSDRMTFEALTEGQDNRTQARLEDLSDVQTVGGANQEAEAQGWAETLPILPRPADAGLER
ncbi:conjugal transfer protein TraN [Thiocystis violacea]|uniref:conjugal transfer protein TraN n=1 Tax=Thiocystis violacea TaxID=13725 RepID=UPI001908A091|nr:conjugal transfer protein TraN [Thiocystis violacea]MBK1717309.1 conjugal transfer protein TraN [Thiocystis violacea]